jgi:hypothetical protein
MHGSSRASGAVRRGGREIFCRIFASLALFMAAGCASSLQTAATATQPYQGKLTGAQLVDFLQHPVSHKRAPMIASITIDDDLNVFITELKVFPEFVGTTFKGEVRIVADRATAVLAFRHCTFKKPVCLQHSGFEQNVEFVDCTFEQGVTFEYDTFASLRLVGSHAAKGNGIVFKACNSNEAVFTGGDCDQLMFADSTFNGAADFQDLNCHCLEISRCTFVRDASFRRGRFATANFSGVDFLGSLDLQMIQAQAQAPSTPRTQGTPTTQNAPTTKNAPTTQYASTTPDAPTTQNASTTQNTLTAQDATAPAAHLHLTDVRFPAQVRLDASQVLQTTSDRATWLRLEQALHDSGNYIGQVAAADMRYNTQADQGAPATGTETVLFLPRSAIHFGLKQFKDHYLAIMLCIGVLLCVSAVAGTGSRRLRAREKEFEREAAKFKHPAAAGERLRWAGLILQKWAVVGIMILVDFFRLMLCVPLLLLCAALVLVLFNIAVPLDKAFSP